MVLREWVKGILVSDLRSPGKHFWCSFRKMKKQMTVARLLVSNSLLSVILKKLFESSSVDVKTAFGRLSLWSSARSLRVVQRSKWHSGKLLALATPTRTSSQCLLLLKWKTNRIDSEILSLWQWTHGLTGKLSHFY